MRLPGTDLVGMDFPHTRNLARGLEAFGGFQRHFKFEVGTSSGSFLGHFSLRGWVGGDDFITLRCGLVFGEKYIFPMRRASRIIPAGGRWCGMES